jgi:hypothetical protein
MIKYLNRSGNSGVDSYEIVPEGIIVKFSNGTKYLYSFIKPGKREVEKLKTLAISGKGLSSYISSHIKNNYEKKF